MVAGLAGHLRGSQGHKVATFATTAASFATHGSKFCICNFCSVRNHSQLHSSSSFLKTFLLREIPTLGLAGALERKTLAKEQMPATSASTLYSSRAERCYSPYADKQGLPMTMRSGVKGVGGPESLAASFRRPPAAFFSSAAK
jgi:hypothetical protein